jgi:putative phosphotransacetylase
MAQRIQIPVALSNRHVHLSREHVEALFGSGHRLRPAFALSQPGQFACHETVEVVGPKGSLRGVRVLGPERPQSQAELSITDGFVLGINLPVRPSGQIAGTPGGHLIGPKGAVKLDKGFICAARHIHLHPNDARMANLKDGQEVCVRVVGRRGVIYEQVVVRVSPDYRTEMHLDLDEGNAGGVKNGDRVEVLGSICDLCGQLSCPIRSDVRESHSVPFCDFAASNYTVR